MAENIHFHPWIARLYDYLNLYFEHRQAPPHRQYLARGISGRVVELGPGTGAMIPYLDASADDSIAYVGVEPDPGMRRQSAERLATATFEGEMIAARAERLPFADDSVDVVLTSCVFCSIPDIDTSLSEIARVLDADGEFLFFEHVRSPGVIGRTQDILTPPWRRFGGNCHLNREFIPRVKANSKLAVHHAEYFASGHYPIRKFVRGIAHPATT